MTAKDMREEYKKRRDAHPILQVRDTIDETESQLMLASFPVAHTVLNNTNVDVRHVVQALREWYTITGEMLPEKIDNITDRGYVWSKEDSSVVYKLLNWILDKAVENEWWTIDEVEDAAVAAGMWAE